MSCLPVGYVFTVALFMVEFRDCMGVAFEVGDARVSLVTVRMHAVV